jgi:hypothetical protein
MVLVLYLAANNFVKHTQITGMNKRSSPMPALSLSETGRSCRARRRAARDPAVAAVVRVRHSAPNQLSAPCFFLRHPSPEDLLVYDKAVRQMPAVHFR